MPCTAPQYGHLRFAISAIYFSLQHTYLQTAANTMPIIAPATALAIKPATNLTGPIEIADACCNTMPWNQVLASSSISCGAIANAATQITYSTVTIAPPAIAAFFMS